MHIALRLASNMGISQARPMEQAAMAELGACLTAFPSGPGAFVYRRCVLTVSLTADS
jgi:hypothetical protein